VNLRLSAKEVGGLIMPPGMIMPRDTTAEKMQEMAAVLPRLVTHSFGIGARGDQPLEPRMENGVKVFDLEVSVIRWHVLPNVAVDAFAYNGQIPGPRIRVTQGDHVRINVHSQRCVGLENGSFTATFLTTPKTTTWKNTAAAS